VAQFREALSLGHTVSVPEFYGRAGAKFALDVETLQAAVAVMQRGLDDSHNNG